MTPISRTLTRTALLVALCGAATTAVISTPAPAFAQHIDARIEAMLTEAADDYDMLMLEEAEAKLEEAVKTGRKQNASARVLSRVYMLLGVVRFANTQDESLAEDAFYQALEIEPRTTLDRVYQTPVLNTAFERAQRRAQANTAPKNVPPPASNTQPPAVADGQLEHTALKRASAGQPLLFEAYVPETMPVFRVYVFHRRFDEEAFTQSEMMPTSNTRFALSLDPKEVRSSQISYYIEAIDRSGKVLASSGRSQDPHTVTVIGSGASQPETPAISVPVNPEPPIETDFNVEPSPGVGFYALLAAGSDIGFLPGGGTNPTANPSREVSAGIAPAFGQALLDLGVQITPSAHLGLYFRWQFSPAQDFSLLPEGSIDKGSGFWNTEEECLGLGLPGDCLLGLKYKWVFSTGFPQFYSSVGGGVGRMRNWLRLKELATNPACTGKEVIANGEYCYLRDTVRTGWAHFGVGGGFNLPLTDNLDFTTDAYLMLFLPDTSINLDLNLGIRFHM